MAYNLDETLSLGFALEWMDTDFRTTTQPVAGGSAFDGRGDLEMTTMNVNGTYHFFRIHQLRWVMTAIFLDYQKLIK